MFHFTPMLFHCWNLWFVNEVLTDVQYDLRYVFGCGWPDSYQRLAVFTEVFLWYHWLLLLFFMKPLFLYSISFRKNIWNFFKLDRSCDRFSVHSVDDSQYAREMINNNILINIKIKMYKQIGQRYPVFVIILWPTVCWWKNLYFTVNERT